MPGREGSAEVRICRKVTEGEADTGDCIRRLLTLTRTAGGDADNESLAGGSPRKGGREMELLSKSPPPKSSAVMGRIHRYYEMGQECFHKLEKKKNVDGND